MSSEVQSLEVSYFVYMTEDEERIRAALVSLLGAQLQEERQEAEGHFGNRIVWVRLRAVGEDASAALAMIVSRMSQEERRAVLGDLGASLDEHNALYIRLSKQAVVARGDAVLAPSDPVRVRVKPRAHLMKGDPARFYSRLLEVPTG
ncbi:MAG: hypothetical protein JRN07_02045 [Nitrososphaerota archaeon]|nr:hypothetical protein [Nitrososphaerota archaeon]